MLSGVEVDVKAIKLLIKEGATVAGQRIIFDHEGMPVRIERSPAAQASPS